MFDRFQHFTDRHALPLSLAVLLGYVASFALPAALSSNSFGRGKTQNDMTAMASQFSSESALAGSVLLLILLFGWAKPARLTTPLRRRGLWWVAPYVTFMALILAVFIGIASQDGSVRFPSATGVLVLLATVALIGMFEELLFRGLLFRGLESKAGPVWALILSSILFGLMHYVNWVGGQPLGDTTSQVVHAATAGFLYGAIMLITGSIWPSIFLHAAWDGMISVVSTISEAIPPELNTETSTMTTLDSLPVNDDSGGLAGFVFSGFEPIYGLIVFAAWLSLRRRTDGGATR